MRRNYRLLLVMFMSASLVTLNIIAISDGFIVPVYEKIEVILGLEKAGEYFLAAE